MLTWRCVSFFVIIFTETEVIHMGDSYDNEPFVPDNAK